MQIITLCRKIDGRFRRHFYLNKNKTKNHRLSLPILSNRPTNFFFHHYFLYYLKFNYFGNYTMR